MKRFKDTNGSLNLFKSESNLNPRKKNQHTHVLHLLRWPKTAKTSMWSTLFFLVFTRSFPVLCNSRNCNQRFNCCNYWKTSPSTDMERLFPKAQNTNIFSQLSMLSHNPWFSLFWSCASSIRSCFLFWSYHCVTFGICTAAAVQSFPSTPPPGCRSYAWTEKNYNSRCSGKTSLCLPPAC